MKRRFFYTATALLLSLVVSGCSADTPNPAEGEDQPAADGHGAVAGAVELAEPQLRLVSIDTTGAVSMLDLLDGTQESFESINPASRVTSDGRYVFAADKTGVSIIDSGVWTWNHVDHFHYYQADSRMLPRLSGEGVATVSTGMLSTAGSTGVFFPESGEALLLDNKALSQGTLEPTLRVDTDPHLGLMVPFGAGALISETDGAELPARLHAIDAAGETLAAIECAAAAGSITTQDTVVVGCADGAVLATYTDDTPSLMHLPYPDGAHAPATTFSARKGRPTVAGFGDGSGVWILDTREQAWRWLATVTPVIAATAVGDADEYVIAVGSDGTVQVYHGVEGEFLASTDAILASTLANTDAASQITVTVDGQRAYVNAVEVGAIFEIDYAGQARIARTLEPPTRPFQFAEVGR